MADTDYDPHTVDVLNRLHARHRSSLLPRLREMHNFISRASTSDVEVAARLAAEYVEHEQWLAEAIANAGGGVYPASADIRTTNLHYLELRAVMPLVERDLQELIAEFEQAQTDTRLRSDAAEVVSRITSRLRGHLDEFVRMKGRMG